MSVADLLEKQILIDEQGISVLPISSMDLDQPAPAVRISTGNARSDGMLGGKGFYQGSSILLWQSGKSPAGKVSNLVSRLPLPFRMATRLNT
jgi:circadian clock protein KaiC